MNETIEKLNAQLRRNGAFQRAGMRKVLVDYINFEDGRTVEEARALFGEYYKDNYNEKWKEYIKQKEYYFHCFISKSPMNCEQYKESETCVICEDEEGNIHEISLERGMLKIKFIS